MLSFLETCYTRWVSTAQYQSHLSLLYVSNVTVFFTNAVCEIGHASGESAVNVIATNLFIIKQYAPSVRDKPNQTVAVVIKTL